MSFLGNAKSPPSLTAIKMADLFPLITPYLMISNIFKKKFTFSHTGI